MSQKLLFFMKYKFIIILTILLISSKVNLTYANQTERAFNTIVGKVNYRSDENLLYIGGNSAIQHRVEHILDHVLDKTTGQPVTASGRDAESPSFTYVYDNLMVVENEQSQEEVDPIDFIDLIYNKIIEQYGGRNGVIGQLPAVQLMARNRLHSIDLNGYIYDVSVVYDSQKGT